jgi:hypothetical protein
MHHLGLKSLLEDFVGFVESLFDIALFRAQQALHVAQLSAFVSGASYEA